VGNDSCLWILTDAKGGLVELSQLKTEYETVAGGYDDGSRKRCQWYSNLRHDSGFGRPINVDPMSCQTGAIDERSGGRQLMFPT
jgi:hypothetical protein